MITCISCASMLTKSWTYAFIFFTINICCFIVSFEYDESHESLCLPEGHNSNYFLGSRSCMVKDHVGW
jgi:hypothetical protein